MNKASPKENGSAPAPPPRDLVREARRLARLRRLRLVADEAHVDHVRTTHDPKEAA
jgi:hypothetical protein